MTLFTGLAIFSALGLVAIVLIIFWPEDTEARLIREDEKRHAELSKAADEHKKRAGK